MKIETVNGLMRIRAESEIEVSFLCLWEAELHRIFEHESVDIDIINNLLHIQPYIEDNK